MLKNLFLTFFLLFISLLTVYPTKKENVNLLDYCYSFEKILARNSVVKNKNLSKRIEVFKDDIIFFGTNKTKGALVNNIIDKYKTSKKLNIISFVPNKFYCLAGYWIEEVNPGAFKSIFYEKSKQKINQYKNTKKEVEEFIKDINSEYKSIKKEIKNFYQ